MKTANLTLGILMTALASCSPAVSPFDECIYTPEKTVFRIWSPKADEAEVLLLDDSGIQTGTMKKGRGSIWKAEFKGDHKGAGYAFRTRMGDTWNEFSPGIFAKAVSVNGEYGVVMDLKETDPDGWAEDRSPDIVTPIVYELHHRDFSISETSGAAHPGKFLALTEPWALGYLQELGVTCVQILPSFDYGSIDETALEENVYNWGYDPKNYNVPEGSYSTDPADPAARIREFKQMVQALHRSGIRVIMDVVYNHTYQTMGCALGRVNPGYFYRHNPDGTLANGSGCGNETASEKAMMRRFMVESVKYWVEEYHVDGFRFDLMGIHDIRTMNEIRAALPDGVLLYGEGWAASAPAYPQKKLAMKANTREIPGVGAFSDDIRDALVGSPFTREGGLAAGVTGQGERLKFGLVGAVEHPGVAYGPAWAAEPFQHISYVTCHDNYCLRDRLALACPEATEEQILRMDKLAQTAVLTSQGIPFLFAGEELFRTKGGDENSFKSPDSVNAINWENKLEYNDLFQYYKALTAIRKEHGGFRLGSADAVRERVSFPEAPDEDVVIYRIAPDLTVVFNGTCATVPVDLPAGTVLAKDGYADPAGLGHWDGGLCPVEPLSAFILAE